MQNPLKFLMTLETFRGRTVAARICASMWGAVGFSLLIDVLSIPRASALPIGYGYNQGDVKFDELSSKNFTLYHDRRAPDDAKLAMRSLEAARPNVERWFDVARSSPLVVNMSAMSDNASFANFVTDSIELQTLGQGGRDLAWHEYTHSTMYRQLDNLFGPAGSILHLPWMEAWFLEGLAEAVSVSIGSDEQAGVERYQALTNNWPTWDRLHSLYNSGPFNFRGYATSGAFVSWILRTHDASKFPELLKTFRSDSMPWYWPWAVMPFNSFLPMDSALKSMTGKSGKELYTQYKIEATAFWKGVSTAPLLAGKVEDNEVTSSAWSWQFENSKLSKTKPPADSASVLVATSTNATAWTNSYFPKANLRSYRIGLQASGETKQPVVWLPRESQWIDGPWLTTTDVWWLETYIQSSKLCRAPRLNFKKENVTCLLTGTMPDRLRMIGERHDDSSKTTSSLWIARDTETLKGDVHEILEVDLTAYTIKTFKSPVGGRPISMATTSSGTWMLTADRSRRHILKLDGNNACVGMIEISDYPARIVSSAEGLPYVVLYTVDGYVARALDAAKFPVMPCRQLSERTSPLLAAMQSPKPLTFAEAVQSSSIWSTAPGPENKTEIGKRDASPVLDTQAVGAAPVPADVSNDVSTDATTPKARPAAWRGRPIFAFPWIASDDPMGPQIGLITVPLMDEMQNETVRATFLLGTVSRFPYQEITLTSNRFKPTWSLSGYRAQTYNGRYREQPSGFILSKYLEEKGSRLDGTYVQFWNRLALEWNWGLKSAVLKKYIGPARRVGHLNETFVGVSASVNNGGRLFASTSMAGAVAAPGINHDFHYDSMRANVTTGSKIGSGRLELGLDGSRTRGPKRRDLQEMYSPLKTLIPGSGGGFNQASFAVTPDQGLFTPVFGENQARARLLATHPLIQDIDKFKSLVYIDQLNISGFLNYGTAWRGNEMPLQQDLLAAQGYTLDLFMDNKGVRFNVGLGAGQVLTRSWQGYWSFGFDALF